MSNAIDNSKEQSNPFSTGGGGSAYETAVQAAFAVFMLTGVNAPCFVDSKIIKIKLQGRYEGYDTDDLLLFTQDNNGNNKTLYAQIKHTISITQSDVTFGEVIRAAWHDYNHSRFIKNQDIIALVSANLSGVDVKNIGSILDWARHSENESEFLKKINTSHFSSDTKIEKLAAFVFHLNAANDGIALSDAEIWLFLRHFRLLHYDLDNNDGVAVSMLKGIIGLSFEIEGKYTYVWERIGNHIQEANKNAGTVCLSTVPDDLSRLVTKNTSSINKDIKRLREYGSFIIESIGSDIGGVHVKRDKFIDQLMSDSTNSKMIIIKGERGCGKSSIMKDFLSHSKMNYPYLCLRAEDFNYPNLQSVFSQLKLTTSFIELFCQYSTAQHKFLFLESLEKILELETTSAFIDLLSIVKSHLGWTIVATTREYAYIQLRNAYLSQLDMPISAIDVDDFSDYEVAGIIEAVEILKPILDNSDLIELVKNPFYLKLAHYALKSGGTIDANSSVIDFREMIWSEVILKESERTNGLPLKRRRAFIDIAVNRANSMQYMIPMMGYDEAVLFKLEEDSLIKIDTLLSRISITHDVLEDWALEQFIDEVYRNSHDDIVNFIKTVGVSPAICRAFRFWLHQKEGFDADLTAFILNIIKSNYGGWNDEAIVTILNGDKTNSFLEMLETELLLKGHELLKRFCMLMRASCMAQYKDIQVKTTDDDFSPNNQEIYYVPYGSSWDHMLTFIYNHKCKLEAEMHPHILDVLHDWCKQLNVWDSLPKSTRIVGLLALYLLDIIKDISNNRNQIKTLTSIIVRCSGAIKPEIKQLLESTVFNVATRKRRSYIDELCNAMLNGLDATWFVKDNPDLAIKLAMNEWLHNENDKEIFYQSQHSGVDICFGLNTHATDCGYFPPSGLKGPFQMLLRFHPKKGMDFIIDLMNITAEEYVNSDLKYPIDSNGECVEVSMFDGSCVKQYYSLRLWGAYRGQSVTPYLLQCALMALENWLIAVFESNHENEYKQGVFNYILRNSKSVFTTAVLVSIATGFIKIIGESALPLVAVAEFYSLDLKRSNEERGFNTTNSLRSRNDALSDIYTDERRVSSTRQWRKETLETVCILLQFSEYRESVLKIIDAFRARYGEIEEWRFRLHRIDTRGYKVESDEKNDCVRYMTGEPEEDLLAKAKAIKEENDEHLRALSLEIWADNRFKRNVDKNEYFSSWVNALNEAKALTDILSSISSSEKINGVGELLIEGIVLTATVCIRDYASDMCKEDLTWCKNIVLAQLKHSSESGNRVNISEPVFSCMSILPAFLNPVLAEFLDADEVQVIKQLILEFLTSASSYVREGIAKEIKRSMWEYEREFSNYCLNISITFAREIKSLERKTQNSWGPISRINDAQLLIGDVQKKLLEASIDHAVINFEEYDANQIYTSILMLPSELDESQMMLVCNLFLHVIDAEIDDDRKRTNNNPPIDYALRMEFADLFAHIANEAISDFTANVKDTLKVAGCKAPEFTKSFLTNLDFFTEKANNKSAYWEIWNIIIEPLYEEIEKILVAGYDFNNNNEHRRLLRSMLYIGTPWQKLDYQKQFIGRGREHLLRFISKNCNNHDVLESIASLMYHFPTLFADDGLKIVASVDSHKLIGNLSASPNATFYLERAIRRYLLVDHPSSLTKMEHKACLKILNALIENASAIGYHLREMLVKSKRVRV